MSLIANELRLGNWVKWGLVEVQITEETAYRTYLKCKEGKVSGIEITPEILERCGFTEDKIHGCYVISQSQCGVSIEFFDNSIHLVGHYSAEPLENIKYLHQLQNLFYSFAGEELNKTS